MPLENLTPLSAKYFFYKIRLEEKLPKAYVIVHCVLLLLSTLGIFLFGTVEAFNKYAYLSGSGSGIWTALFNLASIFLTFILSKSRFFFVDLVLERFRFLL